MRVADAIIQRLSIETSAIYYVPGGGAMYLVDALADFKGQAVSVIHEQGAGFAALGHAMVTDRLGVCMTTSGPGATNAVTACLAAWMDSVPVLFISGQARTEQIEAKQTRVRGVQYADIISMVTPITKAFAEPTPKDDAIGTLEYLIGECLSGRRGPCWLSVPQDVQGAEV